MIDVPADFAAAAVNRAGQSGKDWADSLPGLVQSLCARWVLAVDGAPLHGHLGLVIPVRRGDEPCALKVSWQDATTSQEAPALAAWEGRGAVLLLDHEPAAGAMLLERLDAGRTLTAVDVDEAVTVAGRLLRRLSVPAPEGFTRLADLAAGLPERLNAQWEQLGRPLPRRLIDAAAGLAAEYGPSAGGQLVNGDLHYENVLAGVREPWLAIDPKPLTGDPEYAVAPLVWRRLEDMDGAAGIRSRLAALVAAAGLDADRARAWTLVRTVDYWLWALGFGLTEDPQMCLAVSEALLPAPH
ncbi:aminoglycoside phosphotransferase family protein [Actinacidiphila sp. bgisy160]|uniref:aminoglycoside phosphotransferase family protein n=1 Tax=Actinacidiphila sp. bgisy160 TaxID=3413796 RepID=UPI003D71159C